MAHPTRTDIVPFTNSKTCASLAHQAQPVDGEELGLFLDTLRAEEEQHRDRLRAMLEGLDTVQQVAEKPARVNHQLTPAAHLP